MEQSQSAIGKMALPILIGLSVTHCLNDMLQSVIAAVYPLFKADLALNFAQIGLITFVYQISASVLQPLAGLFFDKRPVSWSLPAGMAFTLMGIVSLAYASDLHLVLVSVALIGIGSSVFHPEASRLTALASGGKRGFAQSLFQVGGNLGGSLGPLLVALLVAPYGRQHIIIFAAVAVLAIGVMIPLGKWYSRYLENIKKNKHKHIGHLQMPLSVKKTVFTIVILLFLIFSKFIYMESLKSYYTFYLIEKFGVSIQSSQIILFIFLIGTAIGTIAGGLLGDRIGRRYVIWFSILGAAPFSMMMPHAGLEWTVILSFFAGLILASAFPAILVYAQELLPQKLGMTSGLFFGFAFGVAGISSAVLGKMADTYGIDAVYRVCAWMPLLGLIAALLPDVNRKHAGKDRSGH